MNSFDNGRELKLVTHFVVELDKRHSPKQDGIIYAVRGPDDEEDE